jgi:hemerythrin
MVRIGWQQEFETGLPHIDEEHRQMFALAGKVIEAWDGPDPLLVNQTLFALYTYVRIHFDHEEAAMRELDYPEYELHRSLHEELAKTLDSLANNQLPDDDREAGLRRLVFDWIVEHIVKHDRHFARFAIARMKASAAPPPRDE